eukprot:GHRR01009729.1.p1 GENE.GHRR01009729.1~~GHRR01009729.1.p1  ORF type:complete len:185 (+),score=71.39 GHRR01009729.1:164-718(+)
MVVVYRWHGASTPGGHELKNAARLLSSSDPAHIQQTEKLEKQLFAKADGWRDGMLQQELRKRNTYLMFALAANVEYQVLGYIIMQVHSITAHINKVAVAPAARRQGVGTSLLRAALHLAKSERGALCATLHVDTINTPALALYGRAGFQQDGLIEDYYRPGKHAYKLIADLQESAAVAKFLAAA